MEPHSRKYGVPLVEKRSFDILFPSEFANLCESGGIGRRAGFRFQWETVGVQVPPFVLHFSFLLYTLVFLSIFGIIEYMKINLSFYSRLAFLFLLTDFYAISAIGMDIVVTKTDSGQQTLEGEIIVDAQDGGIVLRDAMNELHPIQPQNLISKTQDDRAFAFYDSEEIKTKLLAQLPDGFKVLQFPHYLIFYNTSEVFAQWSGGLFERLRDVFTNFWSVRGVTIFPQSTSSIAIIFGSKSDYIQYSKPELGEAAEAIIGYYSMQTNRITLYDLTESDSSKSVSGRRTTNAAQVQRILSQPSSARLVATIVHEATHQIAYNCGLQVRYGDMPRWLSEGIAMYFETPDLKSSKGWGALGKDNTARLSRFKARLNRRNPQALKLLLTDDSLFNDMKTAEDAYCEAWAVTWLLIKQKPDKFVEYISQMSQKKPFIWSSGQERLEQFEACFGNWENVNATLIRVMKNK